MARPIVLIPHLFRLADAIYFRKDYSPPSSPPSRPYNRVYTGSGNVPYVYFESVGDFISKPKCSKFAVGL